MCETQFPIKVTFSRYRILKVDFEWMKKQVSLPISRNVRLQIALASWNSAVQKKYTRAYLQQIALAIMLLPIL